jgi:hypothetical protein
MHKRSWTVFTTTFDGDERSALRPGRFTRADSTQALLNAMLGIEFSHPARSPSLYQLSYPVSQMYVNNGRM